MHVEFPCRNFCVPLNLQALGIPVAANCNTQNDLCSGVAILQNKHCDVIMTRNKIAAFKIQYVNLLSFLSLKERITHPLSFVKRYQVLKVKWPDVPFWPGQYRFWTCCPGVPKDFVGTLLCPVLLINWNLFSIFVNVIFLIIIHHHNHHHHHHHHQCSAQGQVLHCKIRY